MRDFCLKTLSMISQRVLYLSFRLPSYSVFVQSRSSHDINSRHPKASTLNENSMDYFRRKANVYLSKMEEVGRLNQTCGKDPIQLLELCWNYNHLEASQNILALLMEAYVNSRNHSDAFQLFHNTRFKAGFEGKKGSSISLLLMLLMYEEARFINVIILYRHIMDQPKDEDVWRLANALYVASLLETNEKVLYEPPPQFILSRYFTAFHHLKKRNFQSARIALAKSETPQYKDQYFNCLVQIHASSCEYTEVFSLLHKAALKNVNLFSDTWSSLQKMDAKGARKNQLSRHFFWTTSRGLQKHITLKQSLDLIVKYEVENIYEIKKYSWDDIGRWIDTGSRAQKRHHPKHTPQTQLKMRTMRISKASNILQSEKTPRRRYM